MKRRCGRCIRWLDQTRRNPARAEGLSPYCGGRYKDPWALRNDSIHSWPLSNRVVLADLAAPPAAIASAKPAAVCHGRVIPGPGIFVRLVEFGLNPAFAVLFLRSQNLPHQGGLACLVRYVRILAWFLAGAARHLF